MLGDGEDNVKILLDVSKSKRMKTELCEYGTLEDTLNVKREVPKTYSHLIVPIGMRSSYWKYFGFPSDDGENYLSRKKVVCSLCRVELAYNKNTTNLKTHMLAKHKDLLSPKERTIKSKKVKDTTVDGCEKSLIGMEYELKNITVDEEDETMKTSVVDNVGNEDCIEPGEIVENYANKFIIMEESQVVDLTSFDYQEITEGEETNEDEENSNQYNVVFENQIHNVTEFDKTIQQQPEISCNLTQIVCDLIVTDLLDIDIVDGMGFKKFISQLSTEKLPTKADIESNINETYAFHKLTRQEYVAEKIERDYYTITVDQWINCASEKFLTIALNLIETKSDDDNEQLIFGTSNATTKHNLKVVVIDVIAFNEFEINDIFIKYNLDATKCVAVLVNFQLNVNVVASNIPIIPCFIDIIKCCIVKLLAIDDIRKIIEQIETDYEFFLEPFDCVLWEIKWQRLINFLIKIKETGVEGDPELTNFYGSLLKCLRPLQVTLDLLIRNDNIPNSSLIKPLITQLIENHFSSDFDLDSEFIMKIKKIVSEELESRIFSIPFLSVSAFLDPRFTNLINSTELGEARLFLRQKIDQLYPNDCKKSIIRNNMGSSLQQQQINSQSPNQQQSSSGLDYFFTNTKLKIHQHRDKFDIEMNKFMDWEPCSLEQCPIMWWAEEGYLFPSLSKLAMIYTSVPACIINRLSPSELRKRYVYRDSIEKILFLHFCDENE